MLLNPIIQHFRYGKHIITLETGMIARQATAAVMASMDDTTVLCTVVSKKNNKLSQDFFPLTVHYQERHYAAGRFPGNFFRREGRPSEKETLISRLIDRAIRPMFPKSFFSEVQVIATVVSLNPQVNPDIIAIIATSAALSISGIPFKGTLGAARIGYIGNDPILNPSPEELKNSSLDLVIAGTDSAIIMVESEAKVLSEDEMLDALDFGHSQQKNVIDNINELVKKVSLKGRLRKNWEDDSKHHDPLIEKHITKLCENQIDSAYSILNKSERSTQIDLIKSDLISQIQLEMSSSELEKKFPEENEILDIFRTIERKVVRSRLISGKPRLDGREKDMVRSLDIRVGLLSRTHGSALFTRGETQSLVTVTLGTERDAQSVDEISGEHNDRFLFHYNFPHYAVGETGTIGAPKRREIGHGRLAKKGVKSIMPDENLFPYTVRVVSEITESNGSSSMASVCGASLAMMDAGVPIKSAVAGIAMGLVKEDSKFVILSDILSEEDQFGDMDFKVAGSKEGITALQMDIKIEGVTRHIMKLALEQARGARLHILDVMERAINSPRNQISEFAPRIYTIKINPDKIKYVIGKGGSVIRSLTEETHTTIEIDDDGTVKVAAHDKKQAKLALQRIKEITSELETGRIYSGKVTRILDFGALVSVSGGKEGLVHISQIAEKRIERVTDYLKVNQEVKVKVMEIDRQGHIRLSIKEAEAETKS